MTPVIPLPRLQKALGSGEILVKDEGRLPTGSFKARGLALAVSMAKELGIASMAMPTNGNAGSAMAAYCARAGIKAYVELGLGVGIVASTAFDRVRDAALRAVDASHLFEASTTRIGLRRNAYLRSYVYDFIEMFAPHLSRAIVEKTMRGTGSDYEL